MIFFLRKLIEALLLPVGLSAALTIAGVVGRRRRVSIAGVLLLGLFSTHIMGDLILMPLERAYETKSIASAPATDAIVVLSGAIVRGINPLGVQWGDSANRYFTGFDLAVAGKARLIVFSAATADGTNGLTQGAVMRQTAIHNGIPSDRIFVTPKVFTTEDEARAVSQIPGVHSILLVTSASHMPRAVLLFRAQGLDVSPFPTDQRVPPRRDMGALELIPTAAGLELSEMAMREYYGLAAYRLLLLFRPLGHLRP